MSRINIKRAGVARYFISRYTMSPVINNLRREKTIARARSERPCTTTNAIVEVECIPVGEESRSTVRSANNGYWTLIVSFHAHKL